MIRRARQDLSALFGSGGNLAISAFVYGGCAALAYPLATQGGYAGAVVGAFGFCIAVIFVAYSLGASALAFAADSKRSCLPGMQRLTRRANVLASALLLLAFALPVAALAGSPVWRAWAPTVLVLVLGVVLAAVAKWRRVIRQGSRPPSLAEQLRVIGIRISRRGALERAPAAVSRHGSSDRQSPVQIIRSCLGGILMQLSARQLIIGAVLFALFVAAAIGLPWLGARVWHRAVSILALAAAGWVPSGFLTQISKLTRAQLAELALMPGLGAPAAQRRALWRAVLSPPLLWLGIVLLLGSAGLRLQGEPLSSVGVLAACISIMGLMYTVRALSKLATFRQRRRSFSFESLLLYFWIYWVYLELSLLQNGRGFGLIWHWFPRLFITVGILVGFMIAIVIGFPVRRLAMAPHPFLS